MWFRRLTRFFLKITDCSAVIGVSVLLAIAVLVCAEVVARELLSTPIKGSFDLARYFGAYGIFLCLAFVTMTGRQIIIDFITFSHAWKLMLDGIALLIATILVGLATWESFDLAFYVADTGDVMEALQIPLYLIHLAACAGFFFLFIATLIELIAIITKQSN